ncbi:hypothetical protein [Streptomyces sp. RKAG290]|nr:hypothetical protein [Streptomyces sp. RKAG290]MCM2413133.1 hypothetical protein [Streptomyces sp. RKAG290]
MLRSALAASFVAALGIGLLGGSGIGQGSEGAAAAGDIGWTVLSAGSGDIGWTVRAAAPGDIGWTAPAVNSGDIGWTTQPASVNTAA